MVRWGVNGVADEVVHLLVPRGAKVLQPEGGRLRVHESRRFTLSDVSHSRTPPVTNLARSTVDAAVWSRDVWTACRLLVAPIQQRLERAQTLRTELLRAGRVRHRQPLLALANDLCGGADALSEVEFLRFCRRHALPRPRCQRRMDSGGKWRYLDATFRRLDGSLLHVEIDGGVHSL